MNMMHVADDGAELCLFPEEVEPLISDSLDAIGENLATLRDLQDEIDAADLKEDLHFRHQVLKSLREISHCFTRKDQGLPRGTAQPDVVEDDVVYVGTEPLQMDIRLGELKVIQRNAPYMEPLRDNLDDELNGEDSDELEVLDDTLDEDEDDEKAAEQSESTSSMACKSTPDTAHRLRLQLQQTQAWSGLSGRRVKS
ncbi:hypothetical protein GCK32_002750 [Trichostrongylus colubriformis]|uniref:Uncharacterized protein n=1 Tax=Trichostrongylus colubriformis TaxID=6319 RepID=A0AAN8FHI2_TRICO